MPTQENGLKTYDNVIFSYNEAEDLFKASNCLKSKFV